MTVVNFLEGNHNSQYSTWKNSSSSSLYTLALWRPYAHVITMYIIKLIYDFPCRGGRRENIVVGCSAVLVFCAITGVVTWHLALYHGSHVEPFEPPDPTWKLPPSPSFQHIYRRAAVCSDGTPCSRIGRFVFIYLLNKSKIQRITTSIVSSYSLVICWLFSRCRVTFMV